MGGPPAVRGADQLEPGRRARPPQGKDRAVPPPTKLLPAALTVEFYGPRDATAGAKAAQAIGFRVLLRRDRVVVVQLRRGEPRRMIAALSAVGGVKVIRERVIKRPSNDVAAQIMGTARSLKSTALGLSGRGEVL